MNHGCEGERLSVCVCVCVMSAPRDTELTEKRTRGVAQTLKVCVRVCVYREQGVDPSQPSVYQFHVKKSQLQSDKHLALPGHVT